jgi:hypothetical protein
MDNAECNARALSAPVNMFGFALIKNQCLQGKGWQLVEYDTSADNRAKPDSKPDPRLEAGMEAYNRGTKALCAADTYRALLAKTACFAPDIWLSHMASTEKLSDEDRAKFLEWRTKVHQIVRDYGVVVAKYAGASGHRLNDYLLNSVIPSNEKNELNLYDGRVTWGEYNRVRKELATRHMREMKARWPLIQQTTG